MTELKHGKEAEVISRGGDLVESGGFCSAVHLGRRPHSTGRRLSILIVWRTSSSLLIIFAGILLASFLDSCALALGRVLPIGRIWRLSLVILILTGLIVVGTISGARKIPEQASLLIRVMDAQLDVLQQHLLAVGVDLFGPEGSRDLPLVSRSRQTVRSRPNRRRNNGQRLGQHACGDVPGASFLFCTPECTATAWCCW